MNIFQRINDFQSQSVGNAMLVVLIGCMVVVGATFLYCELTGTDFTS